VPTFGKYTPEESMAHVTTQDVLSEAVVEAPGTGRAPRARVNAQSVAEFYDLRPGEVVEKDAFRQARQMRGEWRRERYARLTER
jgi:hypothetical protein